MNDNSYMKNTYISDKAILKLIGKFVKRNRLNQNKSQDEVSKDANISRSTLSLLERGENIRLDSLIQVLRVLDVLYVFDAFEVKEQISPIAYAKLKKQERQKASPKPKNNKTSSEEDLGW